LPQRPFYILPLIVISQFAGTSLWFAGNAILPELQRELHLQGNAIGNITSAVQLGFIAGTFVFAILSVADRFHPSRVFFISSLLAALANLSVIWVAKDFYTLLTLRFITGFFLAGIYPVGMKIAADWFESGLGKALGFLVGALVLGTAFPHLLKVGSYELPWKQVMYVTSAVAAAGGLMMLLLVPAGPFRKRGSAFHPKALIHIFRSPSFRAAAGGYFGHMWELYTFWAFVPVLLQAHQQQTGAVYSIPLWSFITIGVGALSCVAGGYISQKAGSERVAFFSLMLSMLCCFLLYFFIQGPGYVFLPFMIFWGVTVIADSPQLSTLVAQTAPQENRGTALTFVTCIGFAITIVSIQVISLFYQNDKQILILMLLLLGPMYGIQELWPLVKGKVPDHFDTSNMSDPD
jgi:predicted MFS family arabinose efflux permease